MCMYEKKGWYSSSVLHLDCSNRLTAREPLLLSDLGELVPDFQLEPWKPLKRHNQLNSHVPDPA
jgi:hypothetical protein